MKSTSGFSLIELLVSATIMLIVFAMVFTAFIQTRKISERNTMDAEIMQNARIGLDEIARSLRMIGYRRDKERGQVAIIEAAPFQIIFNADLYAEKSALPPHMNVNLYDATTYTSPALKYAPHAETIRWTLDSTDDGIVDRRDINDQAEERETWRNPNDMILIQEIMHGAWSDNQITLGVLGPYDAKDQPTYISPMFQYWLLEADNTFTLLGDKNNDLQLDGEERYFRSITSQEILRKIRRIRITITTESDKKDPFDSSSYRRIDLSTQVSLRNVD
ncbi:MAG: prepilin-type N-terminal cleavage/methylation domain-containing protein [Candidatus Vecturithrix sp.]|jgi:prepilin-type N-terminal cleavage/methylation domain-containing protein|nr:prepilin-type N-terminal cleavage/methylation domain-containing protein [Candidatus Vecturithrix sp.]